MTFFGDFLLTFPPSRDLRFSILRADLIRCEAAILVYVGPNLEGEKQSPSVFTLPQVTVFFPGVCCAGWRPQLERRSYSARQQVSAFFFAPPGRLTIPPFPRFEALSLKPTGHTFCKSWLPAPPPGVNFPFTPIFWAGAFSAISPTQLPHLVRLLPRTFLGRAAPQLSATHCPGCMYLHKSLFVEIAGCTAPGAGFATPKGYSPLCGLGAWAPDTQKAACFPPALPLT